VYFITYIFKLTTLIIPGRNGEINAGFLVRFPHGGGSAPAERIKNNNFNMTYSCRVIMLLLNKARLFSRELRARQHRLTKCHTLSTDPYRKIKKQKEENYGVSI
jgi:hypothetical protein